MISADECVEYESLQLEAGVRVGPAVVELVQHVVELVQPVVELVHPVHGIELVE